MKKQKSILLLFLLTSLQTLQAQDAAAVLEKVRAAYTSAQTLAFSITYTYYEDVKSTQPLKVSKGIIKMSGPQYYMAIDQVQMLRNDTFLVISDPRNKVLMIDSASATPPGNYVSGVAIDTLLKYMGQVTLSEQGGKYLLKVANDEKSETLVKYTELTINKDTYLIEKIVVYYKTITDDDGSRKWNPKMTVEYSGVKVNDTIDKSVFSESRFFNKKGKKLQLTVAYKAYELINHLE